jgi:hypothetical protein
MIRMAGYAPPYLGKLTAKLEVELLLAEKKVIDAKKKLELAEEYRDLCKTKLEEAKKELKAEEKKAKIIAQANKDQNA